MHMDQCEVRSEHLHYLTQYQTFFSNKLEFLLFFEIRSRVTNFYRKFILFFFWNVIVPIHFFHTGGRGGGKIKTKSPKRKTETVQTKLKKKLKPKFSLENRNQNQN